jgi:hypothetical protein
MMQENVAMDLLSCDKLLQDMMVAPPQCSDKWLIFIAMTY